MVSGETTTPGYCFLQLLRSDEPIPQTDIPNEDYIRDRAGRILLKNTSITGLRLQGTEQQGPSHALLNMHGYHDRDIVPAFPCRSWPQAATPWLDKHGKGRWPTQEIKDNAVRTGCVVVAVGSKVAANRELEWRISTCLAERCLMFNLNITQVRCYVLMKMLRKTFLNPHGENNLSSFMCKTILLHCIENTEPNVWQNNNLLTCLTNCLLQLHSCVQRECCPHFIIPGNNLMAGQFSAEVKHHLLCRISDLIESDGRELQRIQIDDFGYRLQIKLNIAPHVGYNLRSPAHISEICSCLLYLNSARQISFNHNCILKAIDDEDTLTVPQTVNTMLQYIKDSSRQEQIACQNLVPFLYTTLGSCLASSNINQTNTVSHEALNWFSAGLNSDVSSSRLKLASAFYCAGDMCRAESILKQTERLYDQASVMPICCCWQHHQPDLPVHFGRICDTESEECIKHITSFCIKFLQSETNCCPRELQHEMFRSTKHDILLKHSDKNSWMDWAVVDSLPYLFFLQYKTYGHLQRYQEQQQALGNLVRTIETETGFGHGETALNLLGQCMEQENRPQVAFKCYMLSLQQRPQNNAANILICCLLTKCATETQT